MQWERINDRQYAIGMVKKSKGTETHCQEAKCGAEPKFVCGWKESYCWKVHLRSLCTKHAVLWWNRHPIFVPRNIATLLAAGMVPPVDRPRTGSHKRRRARKRQSGLANHENAARPKGNDGSRVLRTTSADNSVTGSLSCEGSSAKAGGPNRSSSLGEGTADG